MLGIVKPWFVCWTIDEEALGSKPHQVFNKHNLYICMHTYICIFSNIINIRMLTGAYIGILITL